MPKRSRLRQRSMGSPSRSSSRNKKSGTSLTKEGISFGRLGQRTFAGETKERPCGLTLPDSVFEIQQTTVCRIFVCFPALRKSAHALVAEVSDPCFAAGDSIRQSVANALTKLAWR